MKTKTTKNRQKARSSAAPGSALREAAELLRDHLLNSPAICPELDIPDDVWLPFQAALDSPTVTRLNDVAERLACRLRLWTTADGEMLCSEDAEALKEWDALSSNDQALPRGGAEMTSNETQS